MQENQVKPTIPGVISRFGGSEMLISTGNQSLDELLGDGISVGSLVVIDEDSQGLYSRILLKYFLAEGVAHKHQIFIASQEMPSEKFIHQLPKLIEPESKLEPEPNETTAEPNMTRPKMKIAFRYDNLPTKEKETDQRFGNNYDLSGVMSQEHLNSCKITCWDGKVQENISNAFCNSKYYDLLLSIKNELKSLENDDNILRIGVHSLGSPLWQLHDSDESEALKDLHLFLYTLRMIIQATRAVAYVTIPAHFFEKAERFLHLSEIYVRLQAFAGTELSENKHLSDYHGFIYAGKVTPKNGFKSRYSAMGEHVFKLRRKKFTIETLHLPPDLEATEVSSLSCSSGSKLDF